MNHEKSDLIWKNSQKVFPGGVNSPVRAFRSVQKHPLAMASGSGQFIFDEDGNRYLDFINSWGPLILGHADERVVSEIKKQAEMGTSFGAVTRYELEMAEMITKNIKHAQMIRFVSSGTEAVMSAIRLARAATGKNKIIKFEGCYHGHSDSMLVSAGSGLLTFSNNMSASSSPGVPQSTVEDTIVLPLDDEELLSEAFVKIGSQLAAVIIEALPANSGLLAQKLSFLNKIRNLCDRYGALFILDEVITGFRLGFGGFAEKYNITPDLVTYGKIIGGGLPVGAFAGRSELMKLLSPEGRVYQAGTLSGNPLAMKAGLKTLQILRSANIYRHLNELSENLQKEFDLMHDSVKTDLKFGISLIREESIFWFSFSPENQKNEIRRVDQIWSRSAEIYAKIFGYLLEKEILLAPSAFEVGFLSAPMTTADITLLVRNLRDALIFASSSIE